MVGFEALLKISDRGSDIITQKPALADDQVGVLLVPEFRNFHLVCKIESGDIVLLHDWKLLGCQVLESLEEQL